MVKKVGKNTNKDDTVTNSTVSVDSVTAVTIVPALAADALPHIEVMITNRGNRSLWVRRRAASSDNNKDGRRIAPFETVSILKEGDIYTGEISAIFNSGGANDVFVEYF